jgi:hypothetical protein
LGQIGFAAGGAAGADFDITVRSRAESKTGGGREEIMRAIERFFLRARHWQLFTLLMGLYLVGVVFIFAGELGAGPEMGGVPVGLAAAGALTVFWMLCFMAWIGSMGIFLNALKMPSDRLRMRLLWFALIYTSLYIFVFAALFFGSSAPAVGWGIVPLHLVATFCIFYVAYFAAKSLARVEKPGRVSFYDCAGPLFLIWFFPLGIWFVQRKINRLWPQTTR